MPLVYQHNINDATKLGIWHITEPEDFFLQRVPVKKDVSHPHKRLQHLAGRYLLPELFNDFPLAEIQVADTRKPYLQSEQYHFSISHCGHYAAAVVSRSNRVGVDIEIETPRIELLKHKFISDREWSILSRESVVGSLESETKQLMSNDSRLMTLLWSCKEAIYKWYGSGQLDFKKHMQITGPVSAGADGWLEIPFLLVTANGRQPLLLNARFMDNFVLAWLSTL